MTGALKLVGVGAAEYEQLSAAPPPALPDLPSGDVEGVLRVLRDDFDRAYFVTGVIYDHIYDEGCYFADPTVSFSGLQRWKRNLQLLLPFLEDPRIELRSLGRSGQTPDGRPMLRATWRLVTSLRLPWRPLIDVEGGTDYELGGDGNKIVRHVEFWNVSGLDAVLQMFRPGQPAVGQQQGAGGPEP